MHWIQSVFRRVILLSMALPFVVVCVVTTDEARATLLQEPPKLSRSLSLDGNGHVEIPHAAALNPTGWITVEAWVRRNDDSRCETVISKGFTSAWWLGFCSGRIRFYGSGFGSLQDGLTDIPARVWTHIAVTYQAGGSRRYYINGELDYVGPPNDGPMTSNGLPVQIGRDPDGCCSFAGQIGHVRVWNVVRSQDQIRRFMHVAIDEPLPGLVASWRLGGLGHGGYADAAGDFDGTPVGSASFTSFYGSRAQTLQMEIDPSYGELGRLRYSHATVAIPEREEMLLIGGVFSSTTSSIDRVDTVTGKVTENIGALPLAIAHSSAAYVPALDTAYTFGGSESRVVSQPPGLTHIFAINTSTGETREILPGLPQALSGTTAVYDPVHHKIYVFGGRLDDVPVDTVFVFDPDTEQVSLAEGVSLPVGRSHMGVAYSPVDGRVYLFGGLNESSFWRDTQDTIWQFSIGQNGQPQSVTELSTRMAGPDATTQAVFDSATSLIYLLAGADRYWVSAFEPVTQQLWRTRISLPSVRRGAAAAMSLTGRHALVVGGDGNDSNKDIWQIPLGDAPAVAIGDWRFPAPVASQPTDIHGSGRGLAISTISSGAYRIRADLTGRTTYSPGNLGSAHVNDVHYEPANDHVWISTQTAGGRLRGSTSVDYTTSSVGTQTRAVDVIPGYDSIDEAPLFGTSSNGLKYRRFSAGWGIWLWPTAFIDQNVSRIRHREPGDIWTISNDRLQRLELDSFSATETDFGKPCGLSGFRDLDFAANGDWWLAADAGEFGSGICRISAASTPSAGNSLSTNLGTRAQRLSGDPDGRVWIALRDEIENFFGAQFQRSGGLSVWEEVGGSLRSEKFHWPNAPISSRSLLSTLGPDESTWDSSLSAVGAVDERIWMGKPDGQLITHTPRWRAIDEANDLRLYDVRRIGFARGQAFVGGEWGFHVMQPDGVSWETRLGVSFRDALGDRNGRVWLATGNGIQLYLPAGFDDLSDREGQRPGGSLRALAEDHHGRIWIGGDDGLTLFDRERFVLTMTASNSALPATRVNALFVDTGNRLWIGTNNGLARLDEDRLQTFSTTDGLPNNDIRDIDQLGSGEIVISTAGGGLALSNGSGFSNLPGPYSASVHPISVDHDGRLWAGRAARVNDEWVEYHTTNSGLVSQTVLDIAADLGDRVWFAHGMKGLSVRGSSLPVLANSVPIISAVSQLSGSAGDIVEIEGSGFSTRLRGTRVFIGLAEAEVYSRSSTRIRVRLTSENTSGPISVQVAGQRTTWGQNFCAIPTISHFTPTGGNDGVRVNVYGSNFDRTVAFSAGGAERNASAGPEEFSFTITDDDNIGALVVRNRSFGCNQSATSELTFQRIGVDIDRVVLNQGHISLGLAGNKPTMVQHYLTTNRRLRTAGGYDDIISVDRLQLRFRQDGEPARTFNVPVATRPPTWPLPWTEESPPPASIEDMPPAWLEDLEMSLHATVTPFVPGGGNVEVRSVLYNNGLELDRNREDVDMRKADVLNVLLVPIMPNDYTTTELNDMRAMTDSGLDDARQRLFSFGRVNFYWSPSVVRANDILFDFNEQVDPLDAFELYMASHSLERARRSWNGNSSVPRATIAYGVIHPRANSQPGVTGKAFWPDMSMLVNALGLGSLDALCEFGDGVVEFFSLGLLGGEGCDIAVPLYVGWSVATAQSSRLIGHEVGHILGLVRSHAANGSTTDNPSHSVRDEILGSRTCNDELSGEGEFYSRGRTLYLSPGFVGPVVNPLTRRQFLPQLSETATNGAGTVTSGALVDRGKAIMSYACNRNNRNVFFEPADTNHLRFELDPLVLGLRAVGKQGRSGPAATDRASIRSRNIAGRRMIVSGQVDRDAVTGTLVEVKAVGEQGPLDANYETGWRLIQRDQNGNELARQGVFPVFITSEHAHGHEHGHGEMGGQFSLPFQADFKGLAEQYGLSQESGTQESSLGFFAATLIAADGVARVELSYQDTVLDVYAAGPGEPSVSATVSGPGPFNDSIPVTWSASDPDGDLLTISMEYSADDGSNWIPVGYTEGNGGTLDLPVAVLAGSGSARVRVTASDGFHYRTTTTNAFVVLDQPPVPYIGAPDNNAEYLEGEVIRLSGGAWDASALGIDASEYSWSSDRDGFLGTGAVIFTMPSVGVHQITMEAVNIAGLSESVVIDIVVRGDYDGDGIADDDEPGLGFSPLLRHDVWTDQDGDGLPWLMEARWQTDPDVPDTSGSGNNDAEDIAAGLDPLDASFTLPPDSLTAAPPSLELFHDRRLGTLVQHGRFQLASREAVEWTVSADQAWLRPLRSNGITPDTITVAADSEGLPNGVHQGLLTFSSPLGTEQVLVTLQVVGSSIPVEDEVYRDRFQALLQRAIHKAAPWRKASEIGALQVPWPIPPRLGRNDAATTLARPRIQRSLDEIDDMGNAAYRH